MVGKRRKINKIKCSKIQRGKIKGMKILVESCITNIGRVRMRITLALCGGVEHAFITF